MRPLRVQAGLSTMLTPKQQRFVDEYLVDLNATQAAIRAGYSAKTADQQGSRLLANVKVAAAIREARADLQARTQVTQEWVIEKLRENVERAMQAVPVVDRHGNETGEYCWEGQVANTALQLLGKHLGMFVDRVQHEGNERRPIRFIEVLGSEPEPAEPNADG